MLKYRRFSIQSTKPSPINRSPAARFLVFLIQVYRVTLSPIVGSSCRFYPTCSVYMQEAIELHGALKGSMMGLKRLGTCHPWHDGGYDPVPGQSTSPTDGAN